MLKRLFHRKKKQLPPAPQVPVKAQAGTKKAVKFFNGEIPATDLIETDNKRKFHHSGYSRTWKDDFFDQLSSSDFWGTVALIVTGAFIVCVIYWGFNQ